MDLWVMGHVSDRAYNALRVNHITMMDAQIHCTCSGRAAQNSVVSTHRCLHITSATRETHPRCSTHVDLCTPKVKDSD